MSLTNTLCVSKYGFGGYDFTKPPQVSIEGDCATDTTPVENFRSINHNWDGLTVRGNSYGRWLWMSHQSAAKLTWNNSSWNVAAFQKVHPQGYPI